MKSTVMTIIVLFAAVLLQAQQTAHKFTIETKYLLYLPDGYDEKSEVNWPLFVFLHGSEERGNDLNKVKANGPPRMVEHGKKFPFILVSPQVPENENWEPSVVKKLIDDLKKNYKIDADRIYLTGLSMGGYGTWKIAQEFPQLFAAIAPVCGGGNPERNYRLSHIPIWNFHGAKDDIVLPSESEEMIRSVKEFNANVRFTLYPEANHNSWDNAYATEELYTWMLAQKRFRFLETQLEAKKADDLVGKFASDKDTLTVEKRADSLVIYKGSRATDAIRLRQYEKYKFYLFPDQTYEFRYILDRRSKVIALESLGESRDRYRKLTKKELRR